MANEFDLSSNMSIIDTSSFQAEDLDIYIDCITKLCKSNAATPSTAYKVKKTRKSRARTHRSKNGDAAALNKTTGCDYGAKGWAPSYFSSCYNLNDDAVLDRSALANTTCSTINQTINDDIDNSVGLERYTDIFAYFDADVVPDKTLLESDSDNKDVVETQRTYPKENPKRSTRPKCVTHKSIEIKGQSKAIHGSGKMDRESAMFKVPNAVALERKIIAGAQKPSGKVSTSNDVSAKRLNRTMNDANVKQTQRYSSASTLSLHESDSDSVANQNTADDDISKISSNVRDKISFFNQATIERSSSPATPSAPSAFEDEEYQFQRQKSKRKFQQNRNFFEKIFSERFSMRDQSSGATSNAPKSQASNKEQYVNKLDAVQVYVQTQYMLERIQSLIKAISKLDDTRLDKMDLKKLKKFLLFIRDCSYNCQQVCTDISKNYLTDFEKNVMSAEELLYSALKAVHIPKVVIAPHSCCVTTNIYLQIMN